ncbi:hypothetical protein JW872_00205 [Candidatus Babeliales bacterium]|nr:hypothetical protein [Candidatus Babeliales bacterium]
MMKKYLLWIVVCGAAASLIFAAMSPGGSEGPSSLIATQRQAIAQMRSQIAIVKQNLLELKSGLQEAETGLKNDGMQQLQLLKDQQGAQLTLVQSVKQSMDSTRSQIRNLGIAKFMDDLKKAKDNVIYGWAVKPLYDLLHGLGSLGDLVAGAFLAPAIDAVNLAIGLLANVGALLSSSRMQLQSIDTGLLRQLPLIDSIVSDLDTADRDLAAKDAELERQQEVVTTPFSSDEGPVPPTSVAPPSTTAVPGKS